MEKYNNKITKIDNLELIQVSLDQELDVAKQWAKKESFPWPTVLMPDISKTFIKDIKAEMVPTYILMDKDGKEILRGNSDDLMKKHAELTM